MLVRNKKAPILGRVSMNMTGIEVTDIPDVAVLDEVIAISRDLRDPNSAEKIAEEIGTIPYEILVHIPAHLKRVVE
jgi:alanine racemase